MNTKKRLDRATGDRIKRNGGRIARDRLVTEAADKIYDHVVDAAAAIAQYELSDSYGYLRLEDDPTSYSELQIEHAAELVEQEIIARLPSIMRAAVKRFSSRDR